MCALRVDDEKLRQLKDKDSRDNLTELIHSIKLLSEKSNDSNIDILVEKIQENNNEGIGKLVEAILQNKEDHLSELKESIAKLSAIIANKPTSFVCELERNGTTLEKVIIKPMND